MIGKGATGGGRRSPARGRSDRVDVPLVRSCGARARAGRASVATSPFSIRATRRRSSSSSCARPEPTAPSTHRPSSRASRTRRTPFFGDELPCREGDDYDEITKAIFPRYQIGAPPVPGLRLRRSRLRGRAPLSRSTPTCVPAGRASSSTCSSTSTKTPIAPSSRCFACSAASA